MIQRELNTEGVEELKAGFRVTYAQQSWSAYNEAQADEKELFKTVHHRQTARIQWWVRWRMGLERGGGSFGWDYGLERPSCRDAGYTSKFRSRRNRVQRQRKETMGLDRSDS